MIVVASVLLCGLAGERTLWADWPTWRADASRSASTDESLPGSLALHWTFQLASPQPAWPAEQGKIRFDASYEPVVARGKLFVPSMVHDSVAAYDIIDGHQLWTFYTNGPVRFAPVAYHDRLLFVSDDGYLYCLSADDGQLIWRFRGGPDDRWVLGNDRLVSMWPARGAPVVYGGTVYFAAGIWPFMGIFVHAVDIQTGHVIWTNSGSGSNYTVQQHNSPAFAGVAPQGYLAVNERILLVAGGMTVPAAFDRTTGRLLYFQPSDRTFGKDVGGYEVVLGNGWFVNHGAMFSLADGQPRIKTPASIFAPDCAIGVAGKHLVAHGNEIIRYVHSSVDKKGKETKTVRYRVNELWRVGLPDGITTVHVRAANQLLASDDQSRLVLLDIPTASDQSCKVVWETRVDGVVWRVLVSDRRLFVVTRQGGIFCFGDAAQRPADAVGVAATPNDAGRAAATAIPPAAQSPTSAILQHIEASVTARSGYAIIDHAGDLHIIQELAERTDFHLLVTQPDRHLRRQWREQLERSGLLGTRVHVLPAQLAQLKLPPYMASLIVCLPGSVKPPDITGHIRQVYATLRPYGGTAVWELDPSGKELLSASGRAAQLPDQLQIKGSTGILSRSGALSGAGTWTSQNGDAGNTLVSVEERVKTPLGLLWFGGPPNRGVLPRHGHGPTPQVIGGRLFIEGRNMLRAVDVYTGRLLWQRQFPDVGIFYDNTDHHPGAGAIGGNYVTTPDSVYLIWRRSCLRLDPATGATLSEFQLPPDDSGEHPYWGYVAVDGDHLIAGSSPMLLHTRGPGEKNVKKGEVRHVPLYSQFGEGSHRLVVMNRFTGLVQWTRDARYNFRHNAIAVGDGKLFCLDRMTETRLAYYRRRGDVPRARFCLYALDLESGHPIWQSTEHAFGTWLAYQPQAKLLLQAGSRNRDRAADEVGQGMSVHDAATGRLLWRNDATYGGPPLLYRDTIVTQGTALDLRTGAPKLRHHPLTDEPLPWQFAAIMAATLRSDARIS